MTEDIRADLAALNEEYSGLTAKVQAVYDEVKDIVNSDVNTLGNLQKILWANKKVSALTGVDDPEFPLDDGNGGTVTFTSFRGKLTTKVMQLVALAEAAETEEVEAANGDLTPINTAIAMLGDYDLNKTAEFKNTLATVVEWVEKYLHIDLAEYFEAAIPAPVEPVAYAPEPGPEPADPGDPGPEPLDPGDPGDAPAVVADPGPAPAEVADPGPEPDPILEPAEHAVWETNKADYDQYLLDKADWELAEADYEQYLLDQAAWEAANDAYTDYLAEMMVWTPAHDAYEEYLLEKGVWDANNDDYVAYVEYLAAHNARKAIISNEMDACKALFEDLADVFEATETVDAEDNLNGADGRINGITNFNHPNYGDYQFIEDFEAVLTATDDLIEMYAAAQAAWDELKADIDALPAIDDIRIHDDEIFDAWDAYNAYKDTYYAGTVTNDQFDELATKAVLDAKYTHFCDDIAAAHDLYLEIMALADDLNAIGKPEEFQVDDIIAEVADLRTKIDFYIANYCDEADTDECKFVKDGLDAAVVGYQAQAKALIVKVIKNGDYVDEVEVDGNMYYIGSNPSDRETLKTIFCNMIDGKNTIEFVKADYSQFLSLTLKGGVDPADYPID